MRNLMSLIIVSFCKYVITSQFGVFSYSVLVVGRLRLKRCKTETEILCNLCKNFRHNERSDLENYY
jgi:hypothetical protein